jgi:hypothetical protein
MRSLLRWKATGMDQNSIARDSLIQISLLSVQPQRPSDRTSGPQAGLQIMMCLAATRRAVAQ